jgi:hypothetical protein
MQRQRGYLLEGGNGDEPRSNEYVGRLLELSAREFESPAEVDQAMNEVLDDMEREYFLGALKRELKKLGKSQLLRKLATKGVQLGASSFLPGLQGALQLARGQVKAGMRNIGTQALGALVPGGMATLDAVKSLGLGAGEHPASDRETWKTTSRSRARPTNAWPITSPRRRTSLPRPAVSPTIPSNTAIRQAQSRAAGAPTNRGWGAGRPGRVLRLRVALGQRSLPALRAAAMQGRQDRLRRRAESLRLRIDSLTKLGRLLMQSPRLNITEHQWSVIEPQLAASSVRLSSRVCRVTAALLPHAADGRAARDLSSALVRFRHGRPCGARVSCFGPSTLVARTDPARGFSRLRQGSARRHIGGNEGDHRRFRKGAEGGAFPARERDGVGKSKVTFGFWP